MHALLIVIAIVLLAYGIVLLRRGSAARRRVVTVVAAVLFAVWFFTTDEVPGDFTRMTPYVATLFVLAFAAQRLRMPAADGSATGGARRADVVDVPAGAAVAAAARGGDRGDAARLRAVLRLPGRGCRPRRRRPAAWSAATSRTPRTASALCAECGLVSSLHATGGGRLTHLVCVNLDGDVIMPCGRCRQVLFENGGPAMLLLTVSGVRTMDQVLPDAFGPDALDAV